MFKGKLAVLCLVAAALLVANSTAFAGIIDPCNSTSSVVLSGASGTPVTLAACPQGDSGSFINQGWYIALTIEDGVGNGVPNISPTEFWIDDCDSVNELVVLCGGSASSGADSLTNALGQTTMSNTSLSASEGGGAVGGTPPAPTCSDGMIVIVQGTILSTGCPTPVPVCQPINVRSFDLTGDGVVTSADLSAFAFGYAGGSDPAAAPCIDYDGSNTVNLPDLTTFALHFGPPGHSCN